MQSPVRNIIFDLDGTLVESLNGIEASATHALNACLPERRISGLRDHIGPPIAKMFRQIFPDLDDAQISSLVAAFRRHYDEVGCKLAQLYSGVADTLSELANRGMAMFVVTNKPLHATRVILEHHKLLKLFTEVISPDVREPAFANKIDATRELQRRRQLVPDETVFVGDGGDDAAAAAACGFTFIFAQYGYGSGPVSGARFETIRSFREISDALQEQLTL